MNKKILADESVDYAIVQRLRQLNIEAISVTEKYSGFSVVEVLKIARKYQCLLITEDKDFGELIFRLDLSHYGILLIRLSDLLRSERLETAAITINTYIDKLFNNFSVLTNKGLRIKPMQKL